MRTSVTWRIACAAVWFLPFGASAAAQSVNTAPSGSNAGAAAGARTPTGTAGSGTATAPGATGSASTDTTVALRFEIPAKPLVEALADFARQAGLQLSIERETAASIRSRDTRTVALSGTFTSPEALRRLLAGTDLNAYFADAQTVFVGFSATSDGRTTVAQGLRPVLVRGSVTRPAGYTAPRTATATRTETALRDTPQAVSLITRELIADQAMQGMADVVRFVPGVTMGLGEGHRDQPTIRGNNTTADFFVDGVRDDAQYLRDLYNVDRVEVLKGSNAMIFGRGGGGGVINRVVKDALWLPTRALTFEGGSYDHGRATLDVGQGFGASFAARLNGVAERSGGFREEARMERFGINPSFALAAGPNTTVRLGYEYFRDDRRVDRGIPSFSGRPVIVPIETVFGNPDVNEAWANVHAANLTVEQAVASGLVVRNRARFSDYDKMYQNVVPGAVNPAATQVSLSAYSNEIGRRNWFNQTDVTWTARTGSLGHTLLAGAEAGHQRTTQFRRTGFFHDTAASFTVPFNAPRTGVPVAFRQNATDADNWATTRTAAVFVQDQVALSSRWQAIVGVRAERFDITYHNNRNAQELERTDHFLSPRAGLIYKPTLPVSVYASYSVSYLPGAGDQFTSLSVTTQTLEPERFRNREVGVKWDLRPNLALTAAYYWLDRTNTSAPDPADPAHVVQTGAQRSQGAEVELSGSVTPRWQVAGGVASQRATITRTTSAAQAGATVPDVPQTTVSLWNRYQVTRALALGVGVVHQTEMYAAINNAVRLPGFTRVDGAVYLPLVSGARVQVNVENLFDRRYYASSHGNNNIMPGAPRTVRVGVVTAW